MKKNNLYTAIEQFTPTKTEQKRAQAYQDEITRISKHIGELEAEGQKLLAGVTKELENTEERYSASLREIDRSRGVVLYDMFQQTSAESYALAQKIEELKKEQSELTNSKNNYVRKTDRLFDQYKIEKEATVKEHIKTVVRDLIDYIKSADEEMLTAENITLARKGEVKKTFPLPFNGDIYKAIIQKLGDILNVTERG